MLLRRFAQHDALELVRDGDGVLDHGVGQAAGTIDAMAYQR